MSANKGSLPTKGVLFTVVSAVGGLVVSASITEPAQAASASVTAQKTTVPTQSVAATTQNATVTVASAPNFIANIRANNPSLISPLTGSTYNARDIFDKDDMIDPEINKLVTLMVEEITKGTYDVDTMANCLDNITDIVLGGGEGSPGESYGGQDSECVGGGCNANAGGGGKNCGNICDGTKGGTCGTQCDGGGGDNCGLGCPNKPKTLTENFIDRYMTVVENPQTLSEAFFNQYYGELDGASEFMGALLMANKAEIVADVVTQVVEMR